MKFVRRPGEKLLMCCGGCWHHYPPAFVGEHQNMWSAPSYRRNFRGFRVLWVLR